MPGRKVSRETAQGKSSTSKNQVYLWVYVKIISPRPCERFRALLLVKGVDGHGLAATGRDGDEQEGRSLRLTARQT
jgi:hypothetical protein